MKKIVTASLLGIMLATSMAGMAAAQGATAPDTIPTTITSAQDFIDILSLITDWIFVVLLVIAVIFIVLAGFQFITGGGDPAQISEARSKLIYAAVGIGVALLARGLPAAVQNIVVG